MLRICPVIITIFLLSSCQSSPEKTEERKIPSDPILTTAAGKWFKAWEFVSKEIYGIDSLREVDFVFFDSVHVYFTDSRSLAGADTIDGPALLNKKFIWRKAVHHDSIMLPNRMNLPAGLMSFAAPAASENTRPFFVMPLPSFWKKSGVKSKELGDDNLVTGVFLHEFAHSQQMQNFGTAVSKLEAANTLPVSFNDDVVQEIFEKDSAFTRSFRKEVAAVFDAAATDDSTQKNKLESVIDGMRKRQVQYYTGKYSHLARTEDIFLTMEGLGQYSMYAWFVDPKGAGLGKEKAITGVRRGGKKWSQDEGFGLFLVLASRENSKVWGPGMFGDSTSSVIDLIQRSFKK